MIIDILVGGMTAVYASRYTVALHTAGSVDGVTKQTVPWHLVTHHTCHHSSRVQPHAYLSHNHL